MNNNVNNHAKSLPHVTYETNNYVRSTFHANIKYPSNLFTSCSFYCNNTSQARRWCTLIIVEIA